MSLRRVRGLFCQRLLFGDCLQGGIMCSPDASGLCSFRSAWPQNSRGARAGSLLYYVPHQSIFKTTVDAAFLRGLLPGDRAHIVHGRGTEVPGVHHVIGTAGTELVTLSQLGQLVGWLRSSGGCSALSARAMDVIVSEGFVRRPYVEYLEWRRVHFSRP